MASPREGFVCFLETSIYSTLDLKEYEKVTLLEAANQNEFQRRVR